MKTQELIEYLQGVDLKTDVSNGRRNRVRRGKVEKGEVECCQNCRYCLKFPRNNQYGDIDYMCAVDGYYHLNITIDRNKVRRYTPGGKELECRYEREK